VPSYEVWKFYGKSGTRVIAEDEHDCDVGDIDRMDEILKAIQVDVTEDEAFFKLRKSFEKATA
jgi:hypothetical protein